MFVYVWGTWILSLEKSWAACFVPCSGPQVQSDRSFVNTLCHSRIPLLSTLWTVPFGVQNPFVFMWSSLPILNFATVVLSVHPGFHC